MVAFFDISTNHLKYHTVMTIPSHTDIKPTGNYKNPGK